MGVQTREKRIINHKAVNEEKNTLAIIQVQWGPYSLMYVV